MLWCISCGFLRLCVLGIVVFFWWMSLDLVRLCSLCLLCLLLGFICCWLLC